MFRDFTLPFENFQPSVNGDIPSFSWLTLYYGCPSIPQLTPTNVFNCSINRIVGENLFWAKSLLPPDDLSRCVASIPITVPTTSLERFTSHQSTVEEILSNGFEVGYYVGSYCDQCEASGGQCGANGMCYCDDSSEAYLRCRGSRGVKTRRIIEIGVSRERAGSSEEAEARAIRQGLKIARDYRISRIAVLTDCWHLAMILQRNDTNTVDFRTISIAYDILFAVRSFEVCNFHFISRQFNLVAHELALTGRSSPPFCTFVQAEISSLLDFRRVCSTN